MNLKTLIDDLANRADEILDGCTNPSEAHALVVELLNSEHPTMPPAERQKIADEVTNLLKREGFFDTSPNANSWGNDEDNGDAEIATDK